MNKDMTPQDILIGKHLIGDELQDVIECVDTNCDKLKRHRSLVITDANRDIALDFVSNWLVKHHITEFNKSKLSEKKRILSKYDFNNYADTLQIFPRKDKTRKGNMGEVILLEYLSKTTGIAILVYKLRYNPNIDESMKGDDVLLLDDQQIVLGESKFRGAASADIVNQISTKMKNSISMPLSIQFYENRLYEMGEEALALKVNEIQNKLIKSTIEVKNVGFILSSPTIGNHVEKNMNASNQKFIIISLGISNPNSFVDEAFSRALKIVRDGNGI